MREKNPILFWVAVVMLVIGLAIMSMAPLEALLGRDLVDDPNPLLSGGLLAGGMIALLVSLHQSSRE